MQERKPLYMGRTPKGTIDRPIDGIDTLLKESAEKMGAHVTETMFSVFYGQNFRREYAIQSDTEHTHNDVTENHPELTSV